MDGHLRLVWPESQGAASSSVRELAPEFPFDVARRGYAVGTQVLEAVLPHHDGPTAVVPVSMGAEALAERDGVEAKGAVLAQLDAALAIVCEHDPARITTLGGDCGVSLAPFAALADRYRDDLVVVWIDSHPDMGLAGGPYPGYHAMVVSALTGRGDDDIVRRLPGRVPAERIALVGMHDWTDASHPARAAEWGLTVFPPDVLRDDSDLLSDWIRRSGAAHAAVHFDVDTIDSDEHRFGLGADRGGLTAAQARRVVDDVSAAVDVVGLTIAEYVPRQVMHLRSLLEGFPLLG